MLERPFYPLFFLTPVQLENMSVQTEKKYSASGYMVGGIDAAAKRLEGVDWLRTAFDAFDVDKSGYLDPHELRAALTMLGVRSSGKTGAAALEKMGIDDKDGDGVVSLEDLDVDGDQKVDFEEFKVFAAVLPKRDHAIYRNALAARPITLPKDTSKASAVEVERAKAQAACNMALNNALVRLRKALRLNTDSKLMKDTVLLKKFQELDESGDSRVSSKELVSFLAKEHGAKLAKTDVFALLHFCDTNHDDHMSFDEFKHMMQTVARSVDMETEAGTDAIYS